MQCGGIMAWSVRPGAAAFHAPRQLAGADIAAVCPRRAARSAGSSTLTVSRSPSRGIFHLMVGILVAAVLAALTFAVCMALHLPPAVGVIGAVVVLVASVP